MAFGKPKKEKILKTISATSDDKSERQKSIDQALKEIRTKFGDEAITTYGAGKTEQDSGHFDWLNRPRRLSASAELPADASSRYSALSRAARRHSRSMSSQKRKRLAVSRLLSMRSTHSTLSTHGRSG
jgi:hypothetical protein